VVIAVNTPNILEEAEHTRQALHDALTAQGLTDAVTWGTSATGLSVALSHDTFTAWTPGFDTLGLCARLGLNTRARPADLQREIWITMLASPIVLDFPSVPELLSAVRVRQFMVDAARKTSMDFQTEEAKRPDDCWTYQDHTGFTVRPGCDLIDAVTRATQPEESGTLYSFSCYRATEYVILLGLAHEAKASNPDLLADLQAQWEERAVMSGRFHEVFLREYGTQDEPLPITSYIPGDRIWFRNPDDASSDVAGYEGSWVVYLGNGEFPNFWQHDKPFTLLSKCVEVFHWRDGLYRDAQGEPQINESVVEARVRQTLADPVASAAVLERMFRLRDPKGVYAEGGCMDTTREAPRWIRPGTTDIVLPGMY
jgi:hypothetical protein